MAARVQAATVRMRMTFVEHRFGVEARQRWLRAAAPPLQEVLSAPAKRAEWVDFGLFVDATALVDRMFGRGDLALAWEIGRFSATHEIGVWKTLIMRHVRPAMLVGVAAGMWSHHYDGGRLVCRTTGPANLTVAIEDFPVPHRAHCQSIAGWMHGSLEQGPRKGISVHELACRVNGGRSCEFRISWQD